MKHIVFNINVGNFLENVEAYIELPLNGGILSVTEGISFSFEGMR